MRQRAIINELTPSLVLPRNNAADIIFAVPCDIYRPDHAI